MDCRYGILDGTGIIIHLSVAGVILSPDVLTSSIFCYTHLFAMLGALRLNIILCCLYFVFSIHYIIKSLLFTFISTVIEKKFNNVFSNFVLLHQRLYVIIWGVLSCLPTPFLTLWECDLCCINVVLQILNKILKILPTIKKSQFIVLCLGFILYLGS